MVHFLDLARYRLCPNESYSPPPAPILITDDDDEADASQSYKRQKIVHLASDYLNDKPALITSASSTTELGYVSKETQKTAHGRPSRSHSSRIGKTSQFKGRRTSIPAEDEARAYRELVELEDFIAERIRRKASKNINIRQRILQERTDILNSADRWKPAGQKKQKKPAVASISRTDSIGGIRKAPADNIKARQDRYESSSCVVSPRPDDKVLPLDINSSYEWLRRQTPLSTSAESLTSYDGDKIMTEYPLNQSTPSKPPKLIAYTSAKPPAMVGSSRNESISLSFGPRTVDFLHTTITKKPFCLDANSVNTDKENGLSQFMPSLLKDDPMTHLTSSVNSSSDNTIIVRASFTPKHHDHMRDLQEKSLRARHHITSPVQCGPCQDPPISAIRPPTGSSTSSARVSIANLILPPVEVSDNACLLTKSENSIVSDPAAITASNTLAVNPGGASVSERTTSIVKPNDIVGQFNISTNRERGSRQSGWTVINGSLSEGAEKIELPTHHSSPSASQVRIGVQDGELTNPKSACDEGSNEVSNDLKLKTSVPLARPCYGKSHVSLSRQMFGLSRANQENPSFSNIAASPTAEPAYAIIPMGQEIEKSTETSLHIDGNLLSENSNPSPSISAAPKHILASHKGALSGSRNLTSSPGFIYRRASSKRTVPKFSPLADSSFLDLKRGGLIEAFTNKIIPTNRYSAEMEMSGDLRSQIRKACCESGGIIYDEGGKLSTIPNPPPPKSSNRVQLSLPGFENEHGATESLPNTKCDPTPVEHANLSTSLNCSTQAALLRADQELRQLIFPKGSQTTETRSERHSITPFRDVNSSSQGHLISPAFVDSIGTQELFEQPFCFSTVRKPQRASGLTQASSPLAHFSSVVSFAISDCEVQNTSRIAVTDNTRHGLSVPNPRSGSALPLASLSSNVSSKSANEAQITRNHGSGAPKSNELDDEMDVNAVIDSFSSFLGVDWNLDRDAQKNTLGNTTHTLSDQHIQGGYLLLAPP